MLSYNLVSHSLFRFQVITSDAAECYEALQSHYLLSYAKKVFLFELNVSMHDTH